MMSLKRSVLLLSFVLLIGEQSVGQKITTMPSLHVNFSNPRLYYSSPTSDKPQSKLWFMDSCWWALLNSSSGPTLWQRTNNGWKEHKEVINSLKGIPGQADVWYENRIATAVTVSDSSLCILRLMPVGSSDIHWQAKVLNRLNIPQKEPDIETATIVKDSTGVWWVAADVGGKAIYIWSSKDALHWSSAILMGENISPDDISCIAALKHSAIVIWSNQRTEAVYSREHINGEPIDYWSAIHTISSGNKTADDHINTALSSNGFLWVATKNSVDSINYPQLVLRVRETDEGWKNYPYLLKRRYTEPTRPIVITTPNPNLVLAGHTVINYKNRDENRIVFGIIDTASTEILVKQATVIAPDTSLKVQVNNVTGPKAKFPLNAPWIILASDNKGNVYEADLTIFSR